MIALSALQYVIFETNPAAGYTLANLKFDQATFDKVKALHPLYDATNPDLSAFVALGGKLILWHGWGDPHISPINTIAYYQAVEEAIGKDKTEAATRVYLFPDMVHCGGGQGPTEFDLLTPMLNWVEKGAAPDAILANQLPATDATRFGQPGGPGAQPATVAYPEPSAVTPAATPVRSLPIYPYPFVAAYDGKGDPMKATSFTKSEMPAYKVPDWAGSSFYEPYAPRTQ